jgi:serpin B
MPQKPSSAQFGANMKPETQNVIRLTLAFAKAVAAGQADKSDNVVVSPYNAIAALSMVARGADGKTRAEMAQALFGVKPEQLDAAVADYARLNADILAANSGQVDLKTANGLWVNKNLVTLQQSYADDIQRVLGADISAENFDVTTVRKINDWASQNTNGLIKDIIQQLTPADAAVLASALYFKGAWTNKFDKSLTQDETFAADDGSVAKTPTMHKNFKKGDVRYLDGADFEAVALTYGEKTPDFSKQPPMRLVLVRPKDDAVSARDFLAAQKNVPAWLDPAAFSNARGDVSLPRLDIAQKHDLIPALKKLGIKSAFDGASDFSRMTKKGGKNLYVSKVTQDVVFKTNEEGSEAAAVTTAVVTMRLMSPRPEPAIDFRADRSFVFALQDVKTGAVLFVGAVNKPNNDLHPVKSASKAKPKR